MTKRYPGKAPRIKSRIRLGYEKSVGNLVELAKKRPNNKHVVLARLEGRIL